MHPELSFVALAGRAPGDPLPSEEDRGRTGGPGSPASAAGSRTPSPMRRTATTGLDALAAAWSAWRYATGAAETLGGEHDEHGLPMRIVV